MNCIVSLLLVCLLGHPSIAMANTMETSEAAITKNDVFAIRDALKFYFREFGYYPIFSSRDVIKILFGEDVNGANPRQIVFWEPRPARKFLWIITKRGNLDSNGELLDGWGRNVVFTTDASSRSIAAWSMGQDGTWNQKAAEKRGFYWQLKE